MDHHSHAVYGALELVEWITIHMQYMVLWSW